MDDWIAEVLKKPTTSIEIAGKMIGLSRNGAYAAASRGEIKTVPFGRRLFVPTSWLREVLQIHDGEAA